jgi:hypothetical protein
VDKVNNYVYNWEKKGNIQGKGLWITSDKKMRTILRKWLIFPALVMLHSLETGGTGGDFSGRFPGDGTAGPGQCLDGTGHLLYKK